MNPMPIMNLDASTLNLCMFAFLVLVVAIGISLENHGYKNPVGKSVAVYTLGSIVIMISYFTGSN